MSVPTCVASAVTPDADGGKPTAAATSSASSLPPGTAEHKKLRVPWGARGLGTKEPLGSASTSHLEWPGFRATPGAWGGNLATGKGLGTGFA